MESNMARAYRPRKQDPYEQSTVPLTDLRPRITEAALAALALCPKRVTTVGGLVHLSRIWGDRWMEYLSDITQRDRDSITKAMEAYWLNHIESL
jgi:hypothetical protein